MAIKNNFVILSLGGSLIYPKEGLNIDFLKEFDELIRRHVALGTRFIIVCGGGRVSRQYQSAAQEAVGDIPNADIDWLGIHATRMNAQLLRAIFADIAYPKVIYHYDEKEPPIQQPIIIAAGWKPGRSTDYCATILAKNYGAKTVINLSNIEVLYDKDPNKFKDAMPIEKISWDNFSKLVGDEWTPGANLPFDPIATKLAKELNLTVFIAKGSDLRNLDRILEGKPFRGTIVSPFKLDSTFYNHQYFELGIGYKGYTTTVQGKIFAHIASIYRALGIKIFLRPKSLLGAGCGTGLLVYYLRKLGVDARGIEVSSYGLSKALGDVKPYVQHGSILSIPYSKNSFDMVVSFNVLEHLNEQQIQRALIECNNIAIKCTLHKVYTQENGWMQKFHSSDISKVSIFSKQWWEEFLKKNGYKKCKKFFPVLPKYFETIFILDKKTNNTPKNNSKV